MDEELQTIAGIAAGNPDFSILVAALEATGLTAAVADPDASLTVLAPTNAAFGLLAADLGFAGDPNDPDAVFAFIAETLTGLSAEGDPLPILSNILLYHVLPEAQTAAQIGAAGALTTLIDGTGILSAGGRLIDFEPDLLDPAIAVPDIAASNGIVQVIDRVLLPFDVPGNDRPSITDIAAGTEGFAVLTLALEASGFDALLDDPNGEFTVFAPTDAAFAALAQGFGFEGDTSDPDAVFASLAATLATLDPQGDPIPVLSEILLYHVSPGARSLAELTAAPQTTTALTGNPVIVREGRIFDNEPEGANPAPVEGLTDLVASNGLVQVIDGVLLPFDFADPRPAETIADVVAASGGEPDDNGGDFDILLTALQTAGLVNALSDPTASLTVLAPTDAAFQRFAVELGGDGSTEAAALASILDAAAGLSATGDPVGPLTDILLYHVLASEISRTVLATSPGLTSALGPAPRTDGAGATDADGGFSDALFIDEASDIVTANGLIHAVDAVLLPLNLPDATDVVGTAGDDTLTVAADTLVVAGGAGTDTALFGTALAATSFTPILGGFRAVTEGQSVDLLTLERLEFTDGALVVDDSALAATLYRAFSAALDREDDIAGLSALVEDAQTQGLRDTADQIVLSDAFAERFDGMAPGDAEMVDVFFGAFLGREALEPGRNYWNAQLDRADFDTGDLLLAFAQSTEFRDLTQNATDDGVLLLG